MNHIFTRRDRSAVLYGVTAGVSAWKLLDGQLAFLRERGWKVTVVSDASSWLTETGAREGVASESVPMQREISVAADLASLVAWIKLLLRLRPSVVNVSTPKAGLVGGVASRITRVPRRVYVVRGLRYEGETGRKRFLLKFVERISIACSTDVVVVSESVGERLHKDGVTRRNLLLIGDGSSNGVDANRISSAAATVNRCTVREELGIKDSEFVLGFVGRLTPDKGITLLHEALEILDSEASDFRMLIVGEADPGVKVEKISGRDREILFTGWTEEPWRYMAIMDLLVLPSKREGYPNVVLEANACGVPVVTTHATGAVDSVVHGKTGMIVPVDNPAALASTVKLLRENEKFRTRLAAAAQRRAEEDFIPQRIWRGLESIYKGERTSDVKVLRFGT